MIRHYCDRCREEVVDPASMRAVWFLHHTRADHEDPKIEEEYDLCVTCYEAVLDGIKEGEDG